MYRTYIIHLYKYISYILCIIDSNHISHRESKPYIIHHTSYMIYHVFISRKSYDILCVSLSIILGVLTKFYCKLHPTYLALHTHTYIYIYKYMYIFNFIFVYITYVYVYMSKKKIYIYV